MDPRSPSDTISPTLLGRVRARDADAWVALVSLFGPLVRSWAIRGHVRTADLDDVVQEVFAKVSRALEGFRRDRADDTFLGWLRTITRHRIADYHAGSNLNPVGGTAALNSLGQLPADTDGDDTLHPDDRVLLIRRTLNLIKDEFEPRTWSAFEGTGMDGKSADEVAAVLGMSVGAVYVAKSRVLKRLREELDGLVSVE